MGLLDRLFKGPASLLLDRQLGLGTPWTGGVSIRTLAWADHFGNELDIVSRDSAMQVPAVARARSILVGTIAPMPLRAFNEAGQDVTPDWLKRTASALPLWHRTAYTIDDLLFSEASLWALTRDYDGTILDAARVPIDIWTVDEQAGEILIDDQPVDAADVCYIPGPGAGGLLTVGARTINGATAIERSWVGRAQNPIPLIELHQIGDDALTDEEIDQLLGDFSAARLSPTGAVAFTDNRVEVKTHGEVSVDLFEEARNASVLDIARFANLPAALLDGSMSEASLTYSTQEGRSNEFVTYSIPYWISPIEARLSQDDITPEGTYVRFDTSALTRIPQPDVAPAFDL